MKRASKIYLIVVAVIAVAAVVAIGTLGTNKQKNHIYVMPDGYTGWVQVVYNQQNYAALPKEGKALLHTIPPDGVLMTSSPATSGGMTFYYADESGKRIEIGTGSIHGQSIGTREIKHTDGTIEQAEVNSFFVGTQRQYDDQMAKTELTRASRYSVGSC